MENNKYKIELSEKEIERLGYVLQGIFSQRVKNRAEILLRLHDGDSYRKISKILGVSQNTIVNTIQKYLNGGVGYILKDRVDIDK